MTQDNKDRKLDREIIVKTSIQGAAEKWPDSISRAFSIGGQNNSLFFMIENPVRVKNAKIRSRVTCLKYLKDSGFLVKTSLTIKSDMDIKPITIKAFFDEVSAKYDELKDDPDFETLIPIYRHWDLIRRH